MSINAGEGRTIDEINTSLHNASGHFAENSKLNMADDSVRKPKKERVWTETELKFLALVLADEETEFAVRLETLAANNEVFEEISKKFNELILSNEFKEENEREKSHKQTEIHSIGRFFAISSSILSKELNPSSAAFLLFDKSFTNCVLAQFAAILKFAAKDWSY